MLELVVSWLIGFMVFSSITLSAVYYVTYKLRQKSADSTLKHPTKGKYFKRFVPLNLRKEFDQKIYEFERRRPKISGMRTLTAIAIVGVCFLITSIMFYQRHRWRFDQPVNLTSQEVKNLETQQFVWQNYEKIDLERKPFFDILKNRQLILIKNQSKQVKKERNHSELLIGALNVWQPWLRDNGLNYKTCAWGKIKKCQVEYKRSVFLVMPGNWVKSEIEDWLKQGASVFLYGLPVDAINDGEMFEIGKLSIESFLQNENKPLFLSGHKRSTVGIDPGVVVDSYSDFINYRAIHPTPDGISISNNHFVSGAVEARVVTEKIFNGRLAWTYVNPQKFDGDSNRTEKYVNILYQNLFSFLSGVKVRDVAPWPGGKAYAALLDQDTEEQFENSKNLLPILRKYQVPFTWFILSNLAEQYKGLTREMAEVGEIACHGDNHDVFPEGNQYQQSVRLAKCKKALKVITGKIPVGFRPPEEKYNSDTLSAVMANSMVYIFAESGKGQASPFFLKDKNGGGRILMINRLNSDDMNLWSERKLSPERTVEVMLNEVGLIKAVGGLYAFSFHSQFVNDKNLESITRLFKVLKADDAYLATVSDIAEWWVIRDRLIKGESIQNFEVRKFSPKYLVLDEGGDLILKDYANGQ